MPTVEEETGDQLAFRKSDIFGINGIRQLAGALSKEPRSPRAQLLGSLLGSPRVSANSRVAAAWASVGSSRMAEEREIALSQEGGDDTAMTSSISHGSEEHDGYGRVRVVIACCTRRPTAWIITTGPSPAPALVRDGHRRPDLRKREDRDSPRDSHPNADVTGVLVGQR